MITASSSTLSRLASSLRARSSRGFSLTELAVVTAIILAITAISIPIYLNSRNEAHDTKARENIEHVGNQAASRLIRDRAFTYSEYRTPQVLADIIMSEDPSYDLVPLSDGDGEYRYISEYVDDTGNKDAIGVGINDDGALVLATMSGSGRCWMLVHDPAFASDAGFSFAEADPNFCGWTEGWATNDGVVSPDGPVAANATLLIDFRGDPSDPAELFNLNDYVTLPSGAGVPVFSILADSQLQEDSPQLVAFDSGTGELSFEAPLGVSNATFTLDYQVTLPDMDNASDTGRLTFQIGTPPITAGLGVTLTCDAAPYTLDNIPYGHLVLCTADTGEFTPAGFIWSAPGAAPFDCDNQASCLLTRSDKGSLDVSVEVVDLSGPDPDKPNSDATTLGFTAHPPTVDLECATNVSYASPATCTAIASDPNQEVLFYLWSIDADDTDDNLVLSHSCEPSGLNTCTVSVNRPTTVSVWVTVQDPGDPPNESPATATVNFVNLAPSEPLVSCDRSAPHGTEMTCSVSGAVDPEGEELTYAWELVSDDVSGRGDLPTIVSGCDDSTTCTFTYPNPLDRVNVKVIATDPYAASSEDDTTVLFINSAPDITGIECTSPHEYLTQQSTCTATIAPDAEGDTFTLSWSQPSASPTTCGDSDTCAFTRTTPGAVTTTLTVTDTWGASSTRTATAVFANFPPEATLTCDRTSTNKKGNPTVTCTAEVVDAGNSFEYDFRPSDNALGIDVVQNVNSSSYAVTVSPSGGSVVGTWTPKVTVTDPHGASITVSGPPITIFDAEPSLALEGCTVDTGSWCQVRAVVSDPDDDTASVDWPSAGELGVPSGANRQNCADPSAVSKNDPSGAVFQPATCQYRLNTSGTHTITVTATSGGKQVSNTATITFRNQNPTLSVSVLSGGNCDDAGHSGTSRACTLRATASDPEPGTLTFTFPTISGLSRSGACNGSVSHAGGTNVTRDCTYTWSVPDSSAANRTRPPESSSWTLRANPLNKAVTVRDADGATISRTTPSGFRYRAIANREIPVVSITCSGGGNTVSGAGTLTVAASTTVSCGVSASDPDGISHTYWTFSADLNHNTCKTSSGRYLSSCEMSGSNQSITVYNTARDFYCSVKLCQGGSDGSDVGASGIITVVWQAPPSGDGGCSPTAAVSPTYLTSGGSYTSGGRRFSIFGLGANMTHCNNATRSVVLTAHSVSGASFGAPGGIPTGNFNDILAHGSHVSGTRICQSGVCSGAHNMFVYFRVRQECRVDSSVTLTIEGRDEQDTRRVSRNVSVPSDPGLSGCDGGWV